MTTLPLPAILPLSVCNVGWRDLQAWRLSFYISIEHTRFEPLLFAAWQTQHWFVPSLSDSPGHYGTADTFRGRGGGRRDGYRDGFFAFRLIAVVYCRLPLFMVLEGSLLHRYYLVCHFADNLPLAIPGYVVL